MMTVEDNISGAIWAEKSHQVCSELPRYKEAAAILFWLKMCCEINKNDVDDSWSHENVQRNNDGELKYWCTDHSLFSQQVNEVLEKQSWTRSGLLQNNDGW